MSSASAVPARTAALPARFMHLGITPYRVAWALQDRLAAQLRAASGPESLILLEHPHTYTLGRARGAQHLLGTAEQYAALGAEVVQIDRGAQPDHGG